MMRKEGRGEGRRKTLIFRSNSLNLHGKSIFFFAEINFQKPLNIPLNFLTSHAKRYSCIFIR